MTTKTSPVHRALDNIIRITPITSGSVMDALSGAERTDRPDMGGEPVATQCCVPSRCILVVLVGPGRPPLPGFGVTWPGGLACRAR